MADLDDELLRQMRKGTIEYCVLSLVVTEALTGPEIIKKLELLGGLVTSAGTVYPLLSRISRSGMITVRWRPSSSGRMVKSFEITMIGRQELERFKVAWRQFSIAVNRALEVDNVGQ